MARPKGSKNKVTESAKDNILAVFTRLGGTDTMAAWARKNQTEFYRLYARLIPQELAGRVEHEYKIAVPNESAIAERLARYLAERAPSSQATIQ